MNQDMNDISFQEQQQFRQKWTYLIYIFLIGLLGLFVYAGVQQIVFGKSFGNKPAPGFILIIATLVILTMLLLFYFIKLETRVNKDGIFYKWIPFSRQYKKISWENIRGIEIINYGFVGYGWRLTPGGTVHNIAGNKGLKLTLKTGRKIILGTQKVEELSDTLKLLGRVK